MTAKFAAAVLVLALVLVFVVGVMSADVTAKSSAAYSAAIARQEAARAAELEARALEAQTRAAAALEAQAAIVNFWRWTFTGAGAGLLILFIGAAVIALRWLNLRSQLVYSANGQTPLVMRHIDGRFVIMDAARSLTGVTTAAELPPPTEAAQIQIATQAQATAALVAIASKASGDDVVKRVSKASETLPVPSFGGAGEGPRFVYVKNGASGTTEAQRDLSDLREFIQGAAIRGLSRRAWMGYSFASGHNGTRARYEALIEQCAKAGVIRPEGTSHVLAVSEAEALGAFGIGAADADG